MLKRPRYFELIYREFNSPQASETMSIDEMHKITYCIVLTLFGSLFLDIVIGQASEVSSILLLRNNVNILVWFFYHYSDPTDAESIRTKVYS